MSYKRSSRVIFIFIPSLFFRSVVSKECAVCTLHTTTITATAIISQFYAVLGNNLFYYYKYKYFSIRWCVSVWIVRRTKAHMNINTLTRMRCECVLEEKENKTTERSKQCEES